MMPAGNPVAEEGTPFMRPQMSVFLRIPGPVWDVTSGPVGAQLEGKGSSRRSATGLGLLLALWGCCLAGCEASLSGRPQVAFVSNNPAEFWSIAHAGAKKAALDYDVDLYFRRPSTGTAADQKRLIDALLVRGVQALAISVIDPVNQGRYLDLVASKVRLLCVDNDAPGTRRLCYLGTNNYKAGRTLGRLITTHVLPQGGTVAIFVGMIEPLNARQRWQGVLDELAGEQGPKGEKSGKYRLYGKYRVFGVGPECLPFTDGASPKRAKERADDVLVQLKEEKDLCLVGLWAYNPPALYAAVKAQGLAGRVHIVGFDEDETTLLGIRQGDIAATVVQDPYNFGYKSVELMAKLVRGQSVPLPANGQIDIAERVINRDGRPWIPGVETWNVDDFHRKLRELTGKS
jgi:ribose transport system substrate-binding protein